MLHVTNGDSTTPQLRAAGVRGDVLTWRDVLHDGPLPAPGTLDSLRAERARFIAAMGWAPEAEVHADLAERDARLRAALAGGEEIVLWFEHDLYDQLQLLQVLDAIGERGTPTRVMLAQADDYLGMMAPDAVRQLEARRRPVTNADIAIARRAWHAVTSPDPSGIVALLDVDLSPLPHLQAALRRLLEELPDARSGLARSERQALEAMAAGLAEPRHLYPAAHHDREDAIYLGDSSFAAYLARMSAGPAPLLLASDGSRVTVAPHDDRNWWRQPLALTDAGRRVLAGEADHVALNGVERWLGGVRLDAHAPWRWDGSRLVERRA